MKSSALMVFAILAGLTLRAQAVDYYEMEVYGYSVASPREIEIENGTSVSSDAQKNFSGKILRSSLEVNYGLSEHLELAGYLDYTGANEQYEYTAFRSHLRGNFFEKGENWVDLGAYAELVLPRNFRETDAELELKAILEKDISRWTVSWNPSVELSHTSGESDEAISGGDGDEEGLTSAEEKHKSWQAAWGSSVSVAYHLNSKFRPHLDWHMGLTDGTSLLMPAIDFKLGRGLNLNSGIGFGMNDKTEQRIVALRLEYEMY